MAIYSTVLLLLYSSALVFPGVLLESVPKLLVNEQENNEITEEKEEKTGTVFTCEYLRKTLDDEPTLKWFRNGVEITAKGAQNRVYIDESKNSTSMKIQLFMKMINHKEDEGDYECRSQSSDNTEMSRKIKFKVLQTPQWQDDKIVVGQGVNQKLTINCETTQDPDMPKSTVSVTLSGYDDTKNWPSRYNVVGETVEITGLQIDDRGKTITCTASQVRDDVSTNPVVTKVVTIDVYYEPKFEGGDEIKRYAILGSKVSIPCRVVDSNPNVKEFTFLETDLPSNVYDVRKDFSTQSAFLQIDKVEEAHFNKQFECSADNGHYQKSQIITLNSTTPPLPPAVEDLGADKDYTIWWRIKDAQEQPVNLPITNYGIRYIVDTKLGDEKQQNDAANPKWDKAANNIILNKSKITDKYEITGLRIDTRYGFRFMSINDAGSGDWSQIVFTMVTKKPPATYVPNNAGVTWLRTSPAKYAPRLWIVAFSVQKILYRMILTGR